MLTYLLMMVLFCHQQDLVLCAYQQVSNSFGQTISLPKMKHMVTGSAVKEGDQEPISLEGRSIEAVDEFQYLRSLLKTTVKMLPV